MAEMLMSASASVRAHCGLAMQARAGKNLDIEASSAVEISRSCGPHTCATANVNHGEDTFCLAEPNDCWRQTETGVTKK